MEQNILQLGLAIAPAIITGFIIKHITLPWEKQKHFSERAEILSMLARDIRAVRSSFADALNESKKSFAPLPLYNWQKIKTDERLRKYAEEPIFKTMINQFKEWERA